MCSSLMASSRPFRYSLHCHRAGHTHAVSRIELKAHWRLTKSLREESSQQRLDESLGEGVRSEVGHNAESLTFSLGCSSHRRRLMGR